MSTQVTPTFWKEVLEDRKIALVETEEADACFISSRMSNGKHRLLLDIDREIEFTENTVDLGQLFIKERYHLGAEWRMLGIYLEHLGLGSFVPPSSILTFTHPVEVYPSSTPGHFHLVLDLPDDLLMEFNVLHRVLKLFQQVDLIGLDFLSFAEQKEMAILLKRGVPKERAYEVRHALREKAQRRSSLIYVKSPYGGYGSDPFDGTNGGGFCE